MIMCSSLLKIFQSMRVSAAAAGSSAGLCMPARCCTQQRPASEARLEWLPSREAPVEEVA
jgi:hypothetical protein